MRSNHSKKLNKSSAAESLHDSSAIAGGDLEELSKLAEGVLGCAVQCEDKADYIQSIMTLDKGSQQDMMVLTQRVLMRGEENALDSQSSWAGDNTHDDSLFSEVGGGAGGAAAEIAEVQDAAMKLQVGNKEVHRPFRVSFAEMNEKTRKNTHAYIHTHTRAHT